jgi:hypothetical protein
MALLRSIPRTKRRAPRDAGRGVVCRRFPEDTLGFRRVARVAKETARAADATVRARRARAGVAAWSLDWAMIKQRLYVGRGWRVGAALVLAVAILPRQLCGAGAGRQFSGELATERELGDEVARASLSRRGRAHAERSSGQMAVALDQMAILGLGQIVREHPELRDAYLPAMRAAAARLVDPRTLGFAKARWGESGLVAMAPAAGHAYLGYVNLALGMLRAIDPKLPQTPYAALNDRLTAALAERLDRSPTGLIETYPGETWPPDVAAVAASIGLHAAVTGADRRELLERWSARFARCAVAPSGYLVQRVRSGTCRPVDAPRGSGTALASYFTSFVDPALSRRLFEAVRDRGRITRLGFAGVLEYLPGTSGAGDSDSGPILFGASVGATGFALGAARANGDGDFFRELYRSATFGRRAMRLGRARLVPDRTLGDALLLAMLTANRPLPAPT